MTAVISTIDDNRIGPMWRRRRERTEIGAPSDMWVQLWDTLLTGQDKLGQKTIRRLLKYDRVQIFKGDKSGNTLLHAAATGAALRSLELLASLPECIIDASNVGGRTPLLWAVDVGQVEAVRILLRYGANKSIHDKQGTTALKLALQRGHGHVADILDPTGDALDFLQGISYDDELKNSRVDAARKMHDMSILKMKSK